ncbi:MAG: PDZ domain-containing protein [Myxococcales bacterium]|nr:PDZ domain-containing protein [Myxococcales bacterium]
MRASSILAWTCVAAVVGCGRGRGGPHGLLDAIPLEATAVVQLDPAALRDTWIETVAVALATRAEVPPCVVTRARTATRVVVAWADMLPDDGFLVALTGGAVAPCPELTTRGGIATWSRDLAPRADGDDGYFADRSRRARFTRLAAAPVRGLADHELSAGIVARADVTIDGRDGVDARATVRFDAASAADGARARLDRWRANVDRDRLGGAAAAVQALAVDGPVAGTPNLELTLRMPGPPGAEAAALLAAAVVAGSYLDERMPCPADTAMAPWAIVCTSGEVRVPAAARDRMLAVDGPGALLTLRRVGSNAQRVVVRAVEPTSPLRALGLAADDVVLDVDGVTATPASIEAALAAAATRPVDSTATVRIMRGGRRLTLRYRITP